MDRIINILNTIKLKWFEGYDMNFLLRPIKVAQLVKSEKCITLFFQLVFSCFFRWHISVSKANNNSKILCVWYSPIHIKRNDLKNMFFSVISTIESKDILLHTHKIKFNFLEGIKNIYKLIVWNHQISKISISFKEKLMILRKLIEVLYFDYFLQKKEIVSNRYNLVLCFNDSLPFENFLVQKFHSITNVKTATLQHGIFLAPLDYKNIDFCGIELQNSNSDFLLAWNNFTLKQALLAGMSLSKIKVAGIAKCIDEKPLTAANNNVFGVILDGVHTADCNKFLIKIANELSEHLKMKYILRFHPKMNQHKYDKLVIDKYCAGISSKTDVIQTFCKNVKFSILANSTVFFELVFYKHRVYRYSGTKNLSKYRDVQQCSFTDSADLIKLVESEKNSLEKLKKERNELYDELVTVENIKNSYKSFFLNFI